MPLPAQREAPPLAPRENRRIDHKSSMSERHLPVLQINNLHDYLEPHREVFRGRDKFNFRT